MARLRWLIWNRAPYGFEPTLSGRLESTCTCPRAFNSQTCRVGGTGINCPLKWGVITILRPHFGDHYRYYKLHSSSFFYMRASGVPSSPGRGTSVLHQSLGDQNFLQNQCLSAVHLPIFNPKVSKVGQLVPETFFSLEKWEYSTTISRHFQTIVFFQGPCFSFGAPLTCKTLVRGIIGSCSSKAYGVLQTPRGPQIVNLSISTCFGWDSPS